MKKVSINFSGRKSRSIKYILNLYGIAGLLLLWQTLLWTGVLNNKYMPSPFEIVKIFIYKLTNENPEGAILFTHIFASLTTVITGFALGVIIGVSLGTLMGWYKPVEKFVKPLFELIRPISPIAWIPLMILWLGIGLKAKAFIIFFSAFVPCVINSYTGVENTPEVLINVAKTFGASSFQIFRKVAIPYSLPMTFAGIQISLNSAWATLVAAELLASNVGLGYMILQGRMFGRADIIIVGMLTIGLIGFLISFVLTKVEKIFIKWRAFD
ncbi:MAG: ABC transporter permease [Candidatus Humimicrobiaceae bacterium]